ncbi:hypothetical protein ACOME3_008697 [Neoechinorhynchus agilis]
MARQSCSFSGVYKCVGRLVKEYNSHVDGLEDAKEQVKVLKLQVDDGATSQDEKEELMAKLRYANRIMAENDQTRVACYHHLVKFVDEAIEVAGKMSDDEKKDNMDKLNFLREVKGELNENGSSTAVKIKSE